MAFVFKVETGVGYSDSNSYPSLAVANDYFVIDPYFQATWSGLSSDAVREARLAWATRVLDQKTQWEGTKTVETSALRWPRTGLYDRDGIEIGANTIPVQVIQATLELVKVLNSNDLTAGQDVDYFKRLQVDVIELEWQEKVAQTNIPSIINSILYPLGGIPVGGPRFVRIVKA